MQTVKISPRILSSLRILLPELKLCKKIRDFRDIEVCMEPIYGEIINKLKDRLEIFKSPHDPAVFKKIFKEMSGGGYKLILDPGIVFPAYTFSALLNISTKGRETVLSLMKRLQPVDMYVFHLLAPPLIGDNLVELTEDMVKYSPLSSYELARLVIDMIEGVAPEVYVSYTINAFETRTGFSIIGFFGELS